MFSVYVIWNERAGKHYVGQTVDVVRRVAQHNDPGHVGSRFTNRFSGEWKLVHSEPFEHLADAVAREKELKTGKGRERIKANVLDWGG